MNALSHSMITTARAGRSEGKPARWTPDMVAFVKQEFFSQVAAVRGFLRGWCRYKPCEQIAKEIAGECLPPTT
jgi:hypothetical protein